MSSKKASVALPPNIDFSKSDNSKKDDKCKEFWKYLDNANTLQPYQPPNHNENAKQATSFTAGDRSTGKSTSGKAAKFACKAGKPKQSIKKDTRSKIPCPKFSRYEKIFREGLKLADYNQSGEELLKEIDEYDQRLKAIYPIECSICENVECTCSDEDTE